MLTDSFNRVHNYLRISLTDHCNLRCFYCMPDEDYLFSKKEQLLSADEIFAVGTAFVRLGVNKIRLTGGEPLIRKDFPAIIEKLGGLSVQLHLTTNGILLHQHLDLLKDSGCRHVNVSLDTLNETKYMMLTKRDHFQTVLDNIHALVKNDFRVKVNMVVMKGINDHEVIDFVALTQDLPLEVRFIEFMPFEGNQWSADKVCKMSEMLERIRSEYVFESLPHIPHETTRRFQPTDHQGSFAVISTMSAPFCGDCNRLRLTADGKMKNCLFSRSETDLRAALRKGEALEPLIRDNILHKAASLGGQFDTDLEQLTPESIQNRTMISIGG